MVTAADLSAADALETSKLSRKQRAAIAYIEHNPKFAAFATATDLAERVGVHPSTIVRLAQLLGYAGFPEFQEAVRHQYLNSLDALALMEAHAGDQTGDVVLASIDQEIRNLTATRGILDRDDVRRAARAIERARSTLLVGSGSHAGIALIFTHLCRFMGFPVDAEMRGSVSLAARLSSINDQDVVIGTSAWWVVPDTLETLQFAKERGATTIAVVDNRASALVTVADHVLVTRTESISFFQSMIGPLAVFNALIAELAAAADEQTRDHMRASGALFERLGIVAFPAADDAGPARPLLRSPARSKRRPKTKS
ncbi:MAG TPA: MurR/RpiR family transcriptional regulator [Thermomicrobiales bacterium]|nr:MurR/RpiR family transcriptional regulator [Thermomicrobiales bacterium]